MFVELNLAEILESMEIKYTFEILNKTQIKELCEKIKKIIQEYKIKNVKSEYQRAINNAVNHGSYPITGSIYIGKKNQIVCIITDSGKGFDYKQMIKKYQSGEIYYKLHGFGTKCLASNKHLQIDWHDEGRTIILYYNGK